MHSGQIPAQKQELFSLRNEINKRQSQFQITYIPIDLIYFNHRAMQYSTFTEALLGHGSMDVPLLAWPQPAGIIIMCAVGGGEGSLLLPGGAATTDVLVWSLVSQYRDHRDRDPVSKCQDQ